MFVLNLLYALPNTPLYRHLEQERPLLRAGRIDEAIHIGFVSHHLVRCAQECARGATEASLYADPSRSAFVTSSE